MWLWNCDGGRKGRGGGRGGRGGLSLWCLEICVSNLTCLAGAIEVSRWSYQVSRVEVLCLRRVMERALATALRMLDVAGIQLVC
jgi:hypothetical protein